MKNIGIGIALLCLTSACTWVKVNEDGNRVAVTNASQVGNCERLRTVSVKVTSNLGPVERNNDKVSTELRNMARNEAARYGGDTIVPTTDIDNGGQDFAVYRCK